MQKETITPTNLITTMQDILTVPKECLPQAMDDLQACLVTTPTELAMGQAHQMTDMSEELLMDAVQDGMDTFPDYVKQGCQQLFDDWSNLKPPVLPIPVLSPGSRDLLELIDEVQSMEMYTSIRETLWGEFQALDSAQQEALSGFLAKKLAELMIFKARPYLLSPPKDTVLMRQFLLYTQLTCCRRYGFEELAPYFLRAEGNQVRVLVPTAMPMHDTTESYYDCARTFAVLYYQIPACYREIFQDRLKSIVEDEVLYRKAIEQLQPDTDELAALYLAFLTAEHDCGCHYWNVECYKKYADSQKEPLNT